MRKKQRAARRQFEKKESAGNISRSEVFKFIMTFLLLVYVVLLLIYTSGSTKSFEEVAGNVETNLNNDSLVKMNTQALKRYYGLNGADYDGVILYMSKDSISAEEILMVKAKNDRQIQKIKEAVQERIDNRKISFEAIAPNQVEVLDQARVIVRGKFVFLVVSEDAQVYADLFTGSL